MPESSSTSGAFVRPCWKREPSDAEKALAVLMSLIPVVGLVLCTFDARNQAPRVKAAAQQIHSSAKAIGLLSATDGQLGLSAPAGPTLGERYAQGRTLMAESFAGLGRDLQADHRYGASLPWIGGGVLGVLAVIFCFFTWRLRRHASALFGAACFGYAAFTAAMKWSDMGPVPALLVALAPAFLGALIAWHLVVAVACAGVGVLTCVLPAWAIARSYGWAQLPAWFVPVVFSACALVVALAYLFMVRAALISTLAVGGGLAVALAAATLMVAWRGAAVPWEAILAAVAFFSIMGTVTQYRHSGGPGAEEDDNPYDYRPPPRKPLKLRPA